MIESTEEMRAAVNRSPEPIRMVDAGTRKEFVLLSAEDYDRLLGYDDGPWTDEEMDLLAAEAGELLDGYQP